MSYYVVARISLIKKVVNTILSAKYGSVLLMENVPGVIFVPEFLVTFPLVRNRSKPHIKLDSGFNITKLEELGYVTEIATISINRLLIMSNRGG